MQCGEGVGVVNITPGMWKDACMTLDLVTQWCDMAFQNSDRITIIHSGEDWTPSVERESRAF